jgi:exosortase C (VPDSG-CTERM-specific)
MDRRSLAGLGCTAILIACYSGDLWSLAVHSAATDLNSYILWVPFISACLLFARRKYLPAARTPSPLFATAFFAAGILVLAATRIQAVSAHAFSQNDSLMLTTLSFVLLLTAIGFFFLGREWMSAAAFPIGFLIFLVPLPDCAVNWLETGFKLASADAAHLMFVLSGTPVSRDGTIFQLPGIAFEVAQECSGIHSSLALFITSLVASYIFLKSPWRRVLLVVLVIPLGILRNGFRIWVIGQLCVHIGSGMIHSVIHTKGGPLFFALSLVPLSFLLWFLRRQESRISLTTARREPRPTGLAAEGIKD